MDANELFKSFEVEVNGTKHKLKYTLQSWRLMEGRGITPSNISKKMADSPMETLAVLLYHGLSKDVREKISMDDFCENIDMSELAKISDGITAAVKHSLPESEGATAESATATPGEEEGPKKK